MSMSGLSEVDRSIHQMNSWLAEISERLDWDDRKRAYRALKATLHALRDRLPIEEAAHFAAQLPIYLRGVFYEGWRPGQALSSPRDLDGFIARIESAFEADPNGDPEKVVRAVIGVMFNHVSRGEMDDVRAALPAGLKPLFAGDDVLA